MPLGPPKVRRARAVYTFSEGLTTTLEFPQRFLVSLTGEPPLPNSDVCDDDPTASAALGAVITAVRQLQSSPLSLCNHPGCVYNKGSPAERRNRFVRSIALLDAASASTSSSLPSTVASTYVSTQSVPADGILDSGAARHVKPIRSRFSDIRSCAPVTLMGIHGPSCKITHHGSVDGFRNVLFAPSATASIRSVSSLIDSHNQSVLFSADGAYLCPHSSPNDSYIRIADRKEDDLFHILPRSVPSPSVHALLSVASQIKRERVHQLHRTLGHASTQRMREVLTQHPQLDPGLQPKDVLLFTTCSACVLGNARRKPRPSKTSIRATAFAYRLHFDTSGVVRPSTASGFTRVLLAIDDASRWIFVALLRNASMTEVSTAMRKILQTASATHSVLRTKVVRSDNGTEFRNRMVDALLAESNIEREFTCVGTSHQNGVAESAIGTIFAMARTMLVDASLPPRFWGRLFLLLFIFTTECRPAPTQTICPPTSYAMALHQTSSTFAPSVPKPTSVSSPISQR